MTDTYVKDAMPVAIFGTSGVSASMTLENLLSQAYGDQVSDISSVYVAYYDDRAFTAADPAFSYWDPSNSVVTRVFNNGVDIGGNDFSTFNGITVTTANFDNVTFHVGNNIMPNIYVQVTWDGTAGNRIVDELNVITVPEAFASPAATDGTPTPAEIVSFAKQFGAAYDGVVNGNDCHWIAMAIAASAGATLDQNTQMGKMVGSVFHQAPELNEEGGFWRIAYRGSQASPVDNWETLLQPGDIVRMGWTGGGFHTYTVTELDDGSHPGQVRVVDNTASNGTTTIISEHWVDYDGAATDADSVTIYRLTTDQRYLINGTGGNERVLGTVFNDDFRPGNGDDTMSGGAGSDLYYLWDVTNGHYDTVIEKAGQGTDTVLVRDVSSAVRSYTMTANVEDGAIVGHEASGFTLIGNDRANHLFDDIGGNTLIGGAGNDSLDGGDGFDFLEGGSGNDRYYLNDRPGDYDIVSEATNGGYDYVFVTPIHEDGNLDQYLMYGNVEYAELLGTMDFNLFANGVDNNLHGNAGANVIFGYGGNDKLSGHGGDDTLNGGEGDDTYFLEDLIPGDGITLSHYDTVTEGANGGTDQVFVLAIDDPSSFSEGYTLAANVENGTITGSLAFELDGNELKNALTGNSGANTLRGLDENDTLTGGAGGDVLDGGAGRDAANYANARTGLFAGLEDANANTGDAAGDSYISIENLIGSAHSDILYGDGNANRFDGGRGNDVFVGKGGADTFNGGAGNDTVAYDSNFDPLRADLLHPETNTGDAAGDVYIGIENLEGSTFDDIVLGNNASNYLGGNHYHNGASGKDQLFGRGGNDKLFGYDDNDSLEGGAGNDRLVGGRGQDNLTGGANVDTFVFAIPAESGRAATQRDTITDFVHGVDDINVHAIDANATVAGNQDFTFGGPFTAGHIQAVQSGADTVVNFNTDNDAAAEMSILLKNFTATTLAGIDFIL